MLYEQDLLEKDKEILRLRQLLKAHEDATMVGRDPVRKLVSGGLLDHGIQIVKMMNKRQDEDLKPYLFSIWRLKFLLKRALRLKSTII